MIHKLRNKLEYGFNPIITTESTGLKLLRFGIFKLKKDKEIAQKAYKDRETALVILSGRCNIAVGDQIYNDIGERNNVFDGKPTAIYLPPEHSYIVKAISQEIEVAVITAPARNKGEPVLIKPEHVKKKSIGRNSWKREFHEIIIHNINAQSLFVAETFNQPGKWSSYPPHKHDVYNPPEEVPLEEIYFFKFRPKQGFGMQRIYTQNRSMDQAFVVQNNDTVVISKGYHPVCAAPGYDLYYLWTIAGEERVLMASEDSEHTWILDG